MKSQSLQIKLSMDKGLETVWNYLASEYPALDKASIIRLALNTLAKSHQQQNILSNPIPDDSILEEIEHIKRTEPGPSEDEAIQWWNANKHTLR